GAAGGRGTVGDAAASQGRGGRRGLLGRGGSSRSQREAAPSADHIAFEDEEAWFDDGDTTPGVIR
ncbi:MAG: hypothetical protein JWR42_2328, partial [Marmoricola sp.]|nr:hypothetical protein [Marmoricola sp.]